MLTAKGSLSVIERVLRTFVFGVKLGNLSTRSVPCRGSVFALAFPVYEGMVK